MVGLRSNRATVTKLRYNIVSSFSAGKHDCTQIVVLVGSMPTANSLEQLLNVTAHFIWVIGIVC